MSKKLLTTNTMMTRNQTAMAATASTTNTIAITDNTGDTVIYPTMFDRWKLAI